MELDRLERDRLDEEWGLAEGVTQGVTGELSQDAEEGADFSAAVLVGA